MAQYQSKPQNQRPIVFRTFVLLTVVGSVLISWLSAPARAGDAGAPLNLTAPQQQKLAAMESASRAQAGQLIAQIQQIRKKLSDLYGTYNFDAGAARRLNQDLNRVQGQLLDLHLSEQQQLRGILSADQFAQLQATMHKHDFPGDHGPEDPGHRHGRRNWTDHGG